MIVSLSSIAFFLVLIVPPLVIISLSSTTPFLVLVVHFLAIVSLNCHPILDLGHPFPGDPPSLDLLPSLPPSTFDHRHFNDLPFWILPPFS
jgi:hypothetical protein